MNHIHSHHDRNEAFVKSKAAKPGFWKSAYWIVGIGSMIWLLLRSGTRPRRLSYPCQRVAAANSVGFVAYLATLLGTATLLRRLKIAFTPTRFTLFVVGLLLTATLQASVATPVEPILADSPDLPSWTSDSAVSNVFAITNVPTPACSLNGGNISDCASVYEAFHDDGVYALVNLMEANGDYFYQTAAHPNGIFAADDVIVIKVNNQWNYRNGTNTDVLKGVIYQLVQHPAPGGFTGAVIIAENPQNRNPDWDDQTSGNNSESQDQSYREVAQAYVGQGYDVCISDWKSFRADFVPDYDAGNSTDGYVLDAGDNKLSYPKFSINCGGSSFQISMRYGLWDDDSSSFDDTRLKMINMPVLKRHGSAWGTGAVKNYLGFITTHDGIGRWSGVSEMHCWLTGPSDNSYTCAPPSTTYGLIGQQMAHIRRADLDIVDAIWVNADSNLGAGSVQLDVLLASRDPFAVDYYASDYILGPLIQAENPTHDYEKAMASTTNGWFRNIQMRNVANLRAEGVTDTINMDDGMTTQEELDQFNVYVADANMPTAPTLTLQEPNGGEVWYVGTQQQIEWASTNLDGNVRLDYSTNGFGSSTPIDTSTTNDGTFTWTIPDAPSENVLVRVSSTLTATISDTSNAVFTIEPVPMPSLTLQEPNGGETWTVGTQEQITWSSTNLDGDVRLDYSTDGFDSSTPIDTSTTNDGTFTWTIPDEPSENVLVRVSSTLTTTISDTSDAAFNIASAPTLTLQVPNGGEAWTVDTEQQITWASSGNVGDLALEYSTNDFASSISIDVSTVDDGSYTWTIPDDPSGTVLVRVISNLYNAISDTSDAVFTITSVPLTPTLTVESPNGDEVWTIGTQQQIEWSSTNVEGDVALDYSTDGFASSTIISGSTANDGAYGWNIPVDLSANVLVRVSSVLSSTISDTSDAAFTIAGPYTFDDSYKTVSHHGLEGGERMTYTIVLYEAISATLTLTDVIPAPVSYVPGSANVEPSGSGSLELPGTSIRWSGVVTGAVPVTITFQVDVPDVGTAVTPITNRALVSRNGAPSAELVVTSIINGWHIYMPVVLRGY
ncbi:MAG: DUF362 domain-containing protein [Chloroflexi bacterium]|nr:DUF362 domain-containing protein [Chloroflexota bacterium]